MSYVDQNLIAGETVLRRTKLHWGILLWPSGIITLPVSFVFLLCFVGGIVSREGAMIVVGVLFFLVDAALFGNVYVYRAVSEFAITNKRVIIKLGIVSRRTSEMFLNKIESIVVMQGLLGRVMGYGTVVVKGTGGTPERFKHVPNPLEFRRQVQEQIDGMNVTRGRTVA